MPRIGGAGSNCWRFWAKWRAPEQPPARRTTLTASPRERARQSGNGGAPGPPITIVLMPVTRRPRRRPDPAAEPDMIREPVLRPLEDPTAGYRAMIRRLGWPMTKAGYLKALLHAQIPDFPLDAEIQALIPRDLPGKMPTCSKDLRFPRTRPLSPAGQGADLVRRDRLRKQPVTVRSTAQAPSAESGESSDATTALRAACTEAPRERLGSNSSRATDRTKRVVVQSSDNIGGPRALCGPGAMCRCSMRIRRASELESLHLSAFFELVPSASVSIGVNRPYLLSMGYFPGTLAGWPSKKLKI